SGTSSNMNANEVIAALARRDGLDVHPNDHVNMSQSSNDVIPTAIHVACAIGIAKSLVPAIQHLIDVLETRADELDAVAKTGRTHLMDAMPITFGQELRAWSSQLDAGLDRLADVRKRLNALPQGGTAVGSGINAHTSFGSVFAEQMSRLTGLPFSQALDHFAAQASLDTLLEVSGHLRAFAVSYTKIANDLRWMNSGPLAGLGEIELPTLQPGSSIMPGKVNPVIPEAVAMVAVQVLGNDAAITAAAQSGNFQLNVMLPVVASNLVESISLLSSAATVLADKAIAGFTVNQANVDAALARNPILVTALNREIGYDLGSKIAKEAYRTGRPVLDVALEHTDLGEERLRALLDPMALTRGGIPGSD
ncbi:class II fumarate hydratase, partial [uncultured Abyssibacter sp.]|uniref:class II fumarate hydratase n=1 Tax=uncultured Abyssibacter sp. TaxID=2320202 RepID=UPI0032B1CA67